MVSALGTGLWPILQMTLLPPLTFWISKWWGWSQRNERWFMMNHTSGWMNGWMGGGMWFWTVIGVLVVVLLVVAINKPSKNNPARGAATK